MDDKASFWVAFVLSTIGALLLAGLTLDPATSVRNLQGWMRMVTGTGAQFGTALSVVASIVALLSSLVSLVLMTRRGR